jgi:hypothetical protein
MQQPNLICSAVVMAIALGAAPAHAGVSAAEAARLKADLTPTGAEKAGNKDGTIPAWTGGLTTPTPGFKNGGRRPDPFAGEKPVLQINAKNMDQHADKLTDGVKALLKKYPGTFRLDVYKTQRTAAAPQWLYDNTFQNATRASVVESAGGPIVKDGYGGYPFPIPKTGTEAMLNAQVRWRGEAWNQVVNGYQVTADGRAILLSRVDMDSMAPYYFKDNAADHFDGRYWLVRVNTEGPPIRAGEAFVFHQAVDESRSAGWAYLVGQRRVRKIPNACCDTPHPPSAGVLSFDEVEVYTGRLDRFDWKLVGKKEMLIPYNSNRSIVPAKDSDLLTPHHLNPDHVRWELHRVWVVDATLKPGQRHTSPKSRYYLDEDSWWPVLAERWDANGQLWRVPFSIPVAMPDLPAQVGTVWGAYELLTGSYAALAVINESKEQYRLVSPRFKEAHFSSESLGGVGIR